MGKTLALSSALLLAAIAPARDSEIDALVRKEMTRRHVPGVSVAVVKDGRVVLAKGYGHADVENGVKATADTVYQLGSVTKQFTAALVMMLVEEGRVKLDEPARTYLPEMAEAWKSVTVRQLLTHTSGIPSYTGQPELLKRMRDEAKPEDVYRHITGVKMDFEPGASWRYNNSGYFMLGLLVEKITGKTFRDVLHERILRPLGMTSTDMNDYSKIVKNRARGYDPVPTGRNADIIHMSWPYSAGAMISTVKDMAKWDAALYSDRLLKAATRAEMWSPVKLNSGTTYPYGLGWMLIKINDVPAVEHGGDIPGFNANILRIPSRRLSVIVLCNADPGGASKIAAGIAGLIDPALKVAPPKPIADPDPVLGARLRSIVLALQAGTAKPVDFSEEARSRLFPDLVKTIQTDLTAMGRLTRFDLIEVRPGSATTLRIYRAKLGDQDVTIRLSVDAQGKVAGISRSFD